MRGRLRALGPGKLAIGGLLIVGLLVAAGFGLGLLGTPAVTGVDNSFGPVNDSVTVIESELTVSNPNPVGATFGGVTVAYEVRMNGIPMATGSRDGVAIDRGRSRIPLETALRNDRIPEWWVSHIRAGERTTLTIHAEVGSDALNRSVGAPKIEREIDTSIVEAFNSEEPRELDADQPGVRDPVLVVRETRGEWGNVTAEETVVAMEFDVHNPREYPVAITELGYQIRMNDVETGAGTTNRSLVIPPGETRTIAATTRIRNPALDDWWVTHVDDGQVTRMAIDFYFRVDLSAAGAGSVRLPLDTYERTVETDIFDEKNGSGTPSGGPTPTSSESGGATPTPTPTPESDDPTPTPSATPTPTSTPTPTPDDGLLSVQDEASDPTGPSSGQ